MRYFSDTELEAFLDDDDDDEAFDVVTEDDDDESDLDDEAFYYEDDDEAEFVDDDDDDEGERRYFRKRRSRRSRKGRSFRRSPRRNFNFRGKKSARVMTRGGRSAVVQFSRRFATVAEVKKAVDTLAKDVRKNGSGIVRIDKELKRVDSSLQKAMTKQNNRLSAFEKSIKKQIASAKQDAQQSALLPLLLRSEPKLESFTREGETVPTKISDTVYEDSTLDPITLLALTGGLGGSGGKSSGGLDPIVLLAISGSLG